MKHPDEAWPTIRNSPRLREDVCRLLVRRNSGAVHGSHVLSVVFPYRCHGCDRLPIELETMRDTPCDERAVKPHEISRLEDDGGPVHARHDQ